MTQLQAITFAWLFTCSLLVAQGAPPWPAYEPDEHTLHLWHLDEFAPPFADHGAPAFPLQGLLNQAKPGIPSLPGFGSAISFHSATSGTPGESSLAGGILLAQPQLAADSSDNVPFDFRYFGPDGAFTFELIARLDLMPHDAKVIALGLISMDDDLSDRIFNFRIEKEGFLAFIPLPDSGATGGALATIPLSGPHALKTHHWYHIAVTYNGIPNTPNNLQLYWTALNSGATQAHRIGSGTLSGDLNGKTGDFAVGNEARTFRGNAEAEPFPGLLDEIRISSIARQPDDFFFAQPNSTPTPSENPSPTSLTLDHFLVNASSVSVPANGDPIRLPPGLHRLDFDFGFPASSLLPSQSGTVRCQLEGIDERWQNTERGMNLSAQALDENGNILAQSRIPFLGRSEGWQSSLEDSTLTPRREPLQIPPQTHTLRLILSSGSYDTTGVCIIDQLHLTSSLDPSTPLWPNSDFAEGENIASPAGIPTPWKRGGSDPALARMVQRSDSSGIGLMDGDQNHFGEWIAEIPLDGSLLHPHILTLSWNEAYNVIGGSLHRATYINVPSGRYTFRAIGIAGDGQPIGSSLSIPIIISPPFHQRPWFPPAAAATSVAILAAAMILHLKNRNQSRLQKLKFQNALEKDRTRIARDLHDDIGTRITVINMTASLVERDLHSQPEKVSQHLHQLTTSARNLVVAMDDLVWAVDPSHDNLDGLGSHLTRLAEEIFRDSPIRCRLDIPAILPSTPLSSDCRHHLAMFVKEALHNTLRHAGPCEAFLSLHFDGESIHLTIRDTGQGFNPHTIPRGNGLGNLTARARDAGGSCSITSSPGKGTEIRLTCRILSPIS